MCGCATHRSKEAAVAGALPRGAELTVRVDDMTCGHCASTIAKAVETGLPGTIVRADPATRLVFVEGKAERATVEALIAGAGYTPSAPALA